MTTTIDACRSCGGTELVERINLGSLYLSDFYEDPDERPPVAPLRLVECATCTLVQLDHTVDRGDMYHDRYGYVSGANRGIIKDLASVAGTAMDFRAQNGMKTTLGSAWLDIASNDGTLLSKVPKTFIRVGIDPIEKFAPLARAHANRVIADYFAARHFGGDQFDVITSVSMFYDVHDLNTFVADAAKVLAEDGIWVIQQNYLAPMLLGWSYDNICHEHLTYFSVQALASLLGRHGLEIVGLTQSPINGGCIRTVVAHTGVYSSSPRVAEITDWEQASLGGAVGEARWDSFRQVVLERSQEIHDLVAGVKGGGHRVAIYGASTRGSIIWQLADLDEKLIDAAIDIQPGKAGKYYSALGPVPIELPTEDDKYTLKLVGPYWHHDMFVQQEAEWLMRHPLNRLAFPLPNLTLARVLEETQYRLVEDPYRPSISDEEDGTGQ